MFIVLPLISHGQKLFVTVKQLSCPDKIYIRLPLNFWGWIWDRLNTEHRFVPEYGPSGSVMKPVVTKHWAFSMGYYHSEQTCLLGKNHGFPKIFTCLHSVWCYSLCVFTGYAPHRQGVHLLEVFVLRLMQDNIIMLRFRLRHNWQLKRANWASGKMLQPHKAGETLDFIGNSKQN